MPEELFSRIFAIAQSINKMVEEAHVGSVDMVRNLNDWESREYEELFSLVSQKQINTEPD